MSKAINAAILGLILFLLAYCVCFWFQVMPKFYPQLGGAIHMTPPPGKPIAVKFVGSAVVAAAVGLIAYVVGLRVPWRPKSAALLHAALWLTMAAACIYLIGREAREYIF